MQQAGPYNPGFAPQAFVDQRPVYDNRIKRMKKKSKKKKGGKKY